jgi:hypothetical protein
MMTLSRRMAIPPKPINAWTRQSHSAFRRIQAVAAAGLMKPARRSVSNLLAG